MAEYNDLADLLDKYSDTVYRLALMYVKNTQDAEDVTQDIFLKLYSMDMRFNDAEHEKAWLLRSTINRCKDILKSAWRKHSVNIEEALECIKQEEDRDLIMTISELDHKYRNVIYLFYYEGYSTSEIAGILNKKEATIRKRLSRAREKLKVKISGGLSNEE